MRSREQLHEAGVAASTRGRHARARQLLEQARDGLEPGDLLARIEASLAYVWQETGVENDGVALCRVALDYPGLTRATRGTLHSQVGLLRMLRGEKDDALEAFGEAVALLEDQRLLGRAYLNRGSVYTQRDLPLPAREDFALAAQCFSAVGDTLAAAKARHNLGYVHLLTGDLVGALGAMDAAAPVFAEAGPVLVATAAMDRAEALVAAGLVDEGRTALREASAAYVGRRLYQRRGETELTFARSLVHVVPAEALAAARRSRAQFVRSGAPVWQLRAEHAIHAAEVELGRRGAALITRGDRLAADLEALGQPHAGATARLNAARVAGRRGDLEGMRERLAGVRMRASTPLPVRLLADEVRADLAAGRGRPGEALRRLRTGLDELHEWQSSFGSLDLQTNVIGQGVHLAVRALELAVASPSDTVLFEWSERARMLAARIQPVQAPADPHLAADLAELRSDPAPAREAELRRRIREQAWQKEGSGRVTDPCTLDQVRAALGERALVSLVVGGGAVVALVVTAEKVRRVPLGPIEGLRADLGGLLPDLDVAAERLDGALGVAVRGELITRLDRLAATLVTPLLPLLGDRPVLLTPSGRLAGVPWTLLPGFSGRPVTVAQSATSWLARNRTPLRTGRAGFVAGPRVARAEEEIAATAKEWADSSILTGPDATAAAASALAAAVDVLHVAAHGRHSAQNPLFSGVGLADGTWYGYDVDQLPRVPDIVLLSACEVGRSTVRWGEELIGMTAAWLHAGARCVIASPASVADDAAYDALVALHRGLAAGQAPDVALAAAVPAPTCDRPPAPFLCFA
ncbi:CHAT domain-containing protein [Nocardioides insulae]|uniref:CHAT domain-containing protein n=1 Tax=Nocardioides insulae TaxID=394734 RepID=UPI00041DF6A4|nr:CHAT domain-containing protein [Nocardioides insulae]